MPRPSTSPARPHRALPALLTGCLAIVPACAPQHLADMGLDADFASRTLAADVDGQAFPVGTRLGKEFASGRAVETRFLLRAAVGSWLHTTCLRTPDGSDAVLAPENGVRGSCAAADGQRHDVRSVADCRLCHENGSP